MIYHKPRLQHLGQPSNQSATLTAPCLSATMMLLLMLPNQPLFHLYKYHPHWVQLISSNPTVFRNSFDTLSLALDNKEDNIKALMTFSSLQTTAAPLYVSTVPQHSKNKHQKHKTFHSKPKSYVTLTKKPSTTTGTRSSCSSMEKQSSPMANANGMVFNSYLKKNYGTNH